MADQRVNYDEIAATYNRRFEHGQHAGTAAALKALSDEVNAAQVLEVGCGTGRWLADLEAGRQVVGLDLSVGMLRQAQVRNNRLHLVGGRAGRLPFPSQAFDLVYCVNALHHFEAPRQFIGEARRLLKPGGVLAVIGMDPRGQRETWYIYEYFKGAYETDMRRFPSWGTVLDWMAAEGLEPITWQIVERIHERWVGREVLSDPFLEKNSTSQLILLSDEAYAAGLQQIEAALAEAESAGREIGFRTEVRLGMMAGRRR